MTSSTIEGLGIILFGPGGYVFAGILGGIVGSFINVAAIRMPKGLSVVRPGSHCMNCKTPIAFYDNIPILSYLILRGKCRKCKKSFSPTYAIVELIMAVLGVLCLQHSKGFAEGDPLLLIAHFLTELSFCGVLATLAIIDLRTWILPDVITYPSTLFFWGAAVSLGRLDWGDALAGAGLGFGALAVVILGYKMLTGRDGMGWGDAKLLAAAGAFLGWQALPLIVFLAAIQGILVAMLLALTQTSLEPVEPYVPLEGSPEEENSENAEENRNSKDEDLTNEEPEEAEPPKTWRHAAMPFGPFLALASIETLFLGPFFFFEFFL